MRSLNYKYELIHFCEEVHVAQCCGEDSEGVALIAEDLKFGQ